VFKQVTKDFSAWLMMLQNERDICVGIIGEGQSDIAQNIFYEVIDAAMQLFFDINEALLLSATADNVTVYGFVAILDLIEHLNTLKKPFHKVLAFESQFGHKLMNLLFKKYVTVAGCTLDMLIKDQIAGCARDNAVPENAGYAQVTVMSCNLTICLMDRLQTLEFVINQNKISNKPIREIRQSLMVVLKEKAANYEHSELSGIFLLNNYCYIKENFPRHHPKGSELQKFFDNINSTIDSETSNFQKTLSKCISFLLCQEADKRLRINVRRDRKLVKDRFKKFNTEVKRLYCIYSGCRIPNQTFREIVESLLDLLRKAYTTFYNFYDDLGFVSGDKKYIVYSPESFNNLLSRFFVE